MLADDLSSTEDEVEDEASLEENSSFPSTYSWSLSPSASDLLVSPEVEGDLRSPPSRRPRLES